MTRYQKGANFERKLKKEWEEKGYYVMRSAGSHGPFDLIAVPPEAGVTKLIQVKLRKPTKREIERLQAFHDEYPHTYVYIQHPDGLEWIA